MTWIAVIALALATFVVGAFVFRVERAGWTAFGAAVVAGLAGYAYQANPDWRGAPAMADRGPSAGNWAVVDDRKAMTGDRARSDNNAMVVADAFVRQGQHGNAVAMLRQAVIDDPNDAEAWLALGNALVEHAEGSVTTPALYAYRRAGALDPGGVGPGYSLGLAMIRLGRLVDARTMWSDTLEAAPSDAAGREILAERLGRLDALLAQMASGQPLTLPSAP